MKKVKVLEKPSVERMIEVLSDSEILKFDFFCYYLPDGTNETLIRIFFQEKVSSSVVTKDKNSLRLDEYLKDFISFLKTQRKN
ncbi:hypothetical protein MPTA9241_2340 [Mycoplasmoides pneumoniae]